MTLARTQPNRGSHAGALFVAGFRVVGHIVRNAIRAGLGWSRSILAVEAHSSEGDVVLAAGWLHSRQYFVPY